MTLGFHDNGALQLPLSACLLSFFPLTKERLSRLRFCTARYGPTMEMRARKRGGFVDDDGFTRDRSKLISRTYAPHISLFCSELAVRSDHPNKPIRSTPRVLSSPSRAPLRDPRAKEAYDLVRSIHLSRYYRTVSLVPISVILLSIFQY